MSRKDIAYNYIRSRILSGELNADEPIREIELSESLNMSRTPIREALRDLEAEGVVVSYPSRGTFVAALTPYDVEEIFELRTMMELWALEKGFHRIGKTEIEGLRKELLNADEEGDWEKIHLADLHLHGMIVEKSTSKRLATFEAILNTQIERISYVTAFDSRRKPETLQEHLEILKSIEEGDLERAKISLEFHLKKVATAAIEASRGMR